MWFAVDIYLNNVSIHDYFPKYYMNIYLSGSSTSYFDLGLKTRKFYNADFYDNFLKHNK